VRALKRFTGIFLFCIALATGCSTAKPLAPVAAERRLTVGEAWTLQPPAGRFDASALLRSRDGRLLTVNDKEPGLFEIRFTAGNDVAQLAPVDSTPPRLFQPLSVGRQFPWDLEGLAQDRDGALYFSEENYRWILRQAAPGAPIERLNIDWSPVSKWFSGTDRNASFEGIAVGDGILYVANERDVGRIIEVDLKTLRVVGDFHVAPPGVTTSDVHYTDLCWFDGELWVLCREHRRVLRVNPKSHTVLESFSYFEIEMDGRYAYRHLLPYGFFEGLSVDADNIWLLIDNNGFFRRTDATDARPQLFRCPRPKSR
jgi:hypothetical protein